MNTEIKELVAEGKLDEALDKLVAFLAGQIDQFSPLYRAAQVAQSEFSQIREKELQGLLSEDQIRLANNQVANRILEIIEKVNRGPAPTLAPSPNRWVLYGAGGAVLALIVVLIFRGLSSNENKTPVQLPPGSLGENNLPFPCPTFAEGMKYSIAVFDFTTRTGAPDNSDQFLVQEMDLIFDRNGFLGDATLIESNKGPVDPALAKLLVKTCSAQMVIWGRVFSETEVDINFYAPFINKEQSSELDSLLQIREQGNFQASIKEAALILASRILVMNNEGNRAIALAEQAYRETTPLSTPTTTDTKDMTKPHLVATMTLAHAYTVNKQYKRSIQLYNKVLVKNPHDTVALANKALTQIKTKQVDAALTTIDTFRRYKRREVPSIIEVAGDLYEEKGFTRKGAQFKKDAERIRQEQKLRDPKNLPKE